MNGLIKDGELNDDEQNIIDEILDGLYEIECP